MNLTFSQKLIPNNPEGDLSQVGSQVQPIVTPAYYYPTPNLNGVRMEDQQQSQNSEIKNQEILLPTTNAHQQTITSVIIYQQIDATDQLNWRSENYNESSSCSQSDGKRQRKVRTNLKASLFNMEFQRCDVVFKTILRCMRKTLRAEQFFHLDPERRMQQLKDEQELKMHLKHYASELAQKMREACPQQFDELLIANKMVMSQLVHDLSLFLGSFLLPKLFKVQGKEKHLLEEQIKFPFVACLYIFEIHLCLQAFSICKLEYLASLPTYKVALSYFILNFRNQTLQYNKSMSTQQDDYKKGFNFLLANYTLQKGE